MKILSLPLLLFGLLATAQAQTSSTPLNTDQAAVQELRSSAPLYFRQEPDRAHAVESFCAYLRTYRVKRQYRDSDVVSPAGYTTCVPSKRFELRSAVDVQKVPAPRE